MAPVSARSSLRKPPTAGSADPERLRPQRATAELAHAGSGSRPRASRLDQAIDLATQRNHALLAARTTILQNQAQEITANLRPNPTISWDTQFFPLFTPSEFTADYLENQAQFDLGDWLPVRTREETPAPVGGRARSDRA